MGLFLFRYISFAMIMVVLGFPKAYSIELPSDSWNLNIFSYVTGHVALNDEASREDIELGETSFFVFGRLSNRLSVLSEVTMLPKKYREDTVKVERLRLRFDYSDKHWFSLGKMHTPVNYWNDSFHHGRYFFPTIDRPMSFKQFVPIHEVGFRFSGSRIGRYNFFYDVVLGSGQSARDRAFVNGLKSMTLAVGIRPIKGLEIRTSLYQDKIIDHVHTAGHSGPGDSAFTDIDYLLWSGSIYYENNRIKALGEFSGNRTVSENVNYSAFVFTGWKWSSRVMPFLFYDYLYVDSEEVHYQVGIKRQYGLGVKYIISDRVDLKLDFRANDSHGHGLNSHQAEIRFQLSVSI